MINIKMDLASCTPRRTMLANPLLVLSIIACCDVGIFAIFWAPTNIDMNTSLLPWYHFLRRHGLSAFSTDFSNYTPPYLYFLGLGTLADGIFDAPTIIRGISAAFNIAAAVLVLRFAMACGQSRERALATALLFLIMPEMLINSVIWGQCDIVYTLFLMAFVWLIIEHHTWPAVAMLGIAFAFKLQTLFIAPFVLYLLISRQLQWWQLFVVPALYLLLVIPAAALGRPLGDLLTIYFHQASYFPHLSMAAPNPYLIVRALLSDSPRVSDVGTKVGLIVAVATAVVLSVAFLRCRWAERRERMLLMATLSLTVMPYILPKMHDRYFFPASGMAFLLAVACPRTWPIVALIQLADIGAYTAFLQVPRSHVWLAGGAVLMTVAIVWMVRLLLERPASGDLLHSPVPNAPSQG